MSEQKTRQRLDRWLTVSNLLTFARILLTPVVVYGISRERWGLAFGGFIVASFTDLLDGYVARRFNEQSSLGVILDPLADKVFLVSCFTALAFLNTPSFQIPIWFVGMVVGREVIMLLGSGLMILSGARVEIKPIIWGKLTTFFQLVFICWIFVCYFFDWAPVRTYGVFLVFLAIFSLLSFLQYIKIWLNYVGNLKK